MAVVIPSDWEILPIGSVGELSTGTTPPTQDRSLYGDEYPFISPADLGSEKYIRNAEKNLSAKGYLSTRQIPKGSLLFVCIGSTIGKTGIATTSSSCNQQINYLVPSEKYHSEYLYYALSAIAPIVKEQAGEQAVPMVNKSEFAKFTIPVPKLNEQIAIAKALSEIDELIENLRNEILKLELVFEAQKDFYFSKENTKKWEAFKIAEIGVLSTATRKQSNFESSSGFVILDMGSVSDKGLILETKYTRESLDLLSVGDLVIPKDDIGGGNIIGKAVHVPTANRYVLGDHVFKLSVDKKVFSPEFTRYILNSKESNKRVISLVAGSAQLGLPKSSFLTHQLSFPNLETQNSISEKLYATEVSLYSSKQNLNKYECIKQGMAHDLLTGKVRLV